MQAKLTGKIFKSSKPDAAALISVDLNGLFLLCFVSEEKIEKKKKEFPK